MPPLPYPHPNINLKNDGMSKMDKSTQFLLVMEIMEILNLNCETAEEAKELLEKVHELIGLRWSN
jgi:hypothetical protein